MNKALSFNPGALIQRVGVLPRPEDDAELKRRVLIIMTLMTATAGIVWGLIYVGFSEMRAAVIPFGYSLLSLLNLIGLVIVGSLVFFRSVQLLLILMLPFLLMMMLGGFVNSGAVILWSLLAPLVALLVCGRKEAGRWFIAYLALIIVSGFLELGSPHTNNLPTDVIIAFFVLNICIPTLCAFLLLIYFVGQKNQAMNLLGEEKRKSERLLLNVLPQEIASLLIDHEDRRIAEYCDQVSVLFADVVGFTPLSEVLTPQEAVDVLDEIFTYFDQLAERHGVEKIRTIGDAYMAATGVPIPRHDHAQALARMALEMIEYVDSRPPCAGVALQVRIGVNSGPAVAGVIGTTKFHYDLWGDAVNIAARMESHGEPGKIQIAASTYDLIRDGFVCESRGVIPIKGKANMETWFLIAERTPPPDEASLNAASL
jgi:guanylate cyclase